MTPAQRALVEAIHEQVVATRRTAMFEQRRIDGARICADLGRALAAVTEAERSES